MTKFKYIWLTGHHTLFIATLTTGMLSVMPVFANSEWLMIAVAAVISGFMMTVMPALSMPFMKKITGGDSFAMVTSASPPTLSLAGLASSLAIRKIPLRIWNSPTGSAS